MKEILVVAIGGAGFAMGAAISMYLDVVQGTQDPALHFALGAMAGLVLGIRISCSNQR